MRISDKARAIHASKTGDAKDVDRGMPIHLLYNDGRIYVGFGHNSSESQGTTDIPDGVATFTRAASFKTFTRAEVIELQKTHNVVFVRLAYTMHRWVEDGFPDDIEPYFVVAGERGKVKRISLEKAMQIYEDGKRFCDAVRANTDKVIIEKPKCLETTLEAQQSDVVLGGASNGGKTLEKDKPHPDNIWHRLKTWKES